MIMSLARSTKKRYRSSSRYPRSWVQYRPSLDAAGQLIADGPIGLVDHEDLHARIVDDVLEFGHGGSGIQWHDHGAHSRHCEQALEIAKAVGHEHGDPVARSHAEARQRTGELPAAASQLGVAHLRRSVDRCRLAGEEELGAPQGVGGQRRLHPHWTHPLRWLGDSATSCDVTGRDVARKTTKATASSTSQGPTVSVPQRDLVEASSPVCCKPASGSSLGLPLEWGRLS